MNNNEVNNNYQSRYERNNQNNLYEQNNNNIGNMQPNTTIPNTNGYELNNQNQKLNLTNNNVPQPNTNIINTVNSEVNNVNQMQNITNNNINSPNPTNSTTTNTNQTISNIPEGNNQNENDYIFDKKQQKIIEGKGIGKKIATILIVLILLAGGLYLFYNYFLMNEEKIIKNNTSNIFKLLEKTIDNLDKNTLNYDFEKESLGIEGKLNISVDGKIEKIDLSKLKDYNLAYNGILDINNNKLSGNVILNNNDKKLLSLYAYLNGNILLLKSEELYNRPIKTETESSVKDIKTTKSLNYKDIKTLVTKTKEITLNYIDKNKISKEIVKKDNKSYMKVSYTIDEIKYSQELIKEYLYDEELLKIISNLSNQKQDEVEKELKEQLKELEKEKKHNLNIDIYLDIITANFKQVDISEEKNTISITKTNDKYEFKVLEDNEPTLTGIYNIKNKELYLETQEDKNITKVTIKEVNKNNYNINLTTKVEDAETNIIIDLKTEMADNTQTTETHITAKIKEKNEELTLGINNNIKLSKDTKVEEISSDNAKDIENLTEDDIETIQSNLLEILQPLLEQFTKIEESNLI